MARYYELTERGKNFLESGLVLDGGFEDSKLMQLLALLDKGPAKRKTLEEKLYPNCRARGRWAGNLVEEATGLGYIVLDGNAPIVPEYMPVRKPRDIEDALKNPIRKKIYQYVTKNPGSYRSQICRALGLNNCYHLNLLLSTGSLKSKKIRGKVYYFLQGQEDKITNYAHKNILRMVREHPGINQISLAQKLDISTRSACYHLRFMEKNQLILAKKEGRERHYYIPKTA